MKMKQFCFVRRGMMREMEKAEIHNRKQRSTATTAEMTFLNLMMRMRQMMIAKIIPNTKVTTAAKTVVATASPIKTRRQQRTIWDLRFFAILTRMAKLLLMIFIMHSLMFCQTKSMPTSV